MISRKMGLERGTKSSGRPAYNVFAPPAPAVACPAPPAAPAPSEPSASPTPGGSPPAASPSPQSSEPSPGNDHDEGAIAGKPRIRRKVLAFSPKP